jgi:hypothetical protein
MSVGRVSAARASADAQADDPADGQDHPDLGTVVPPLERRDELSAHARRGGHLDLGEVLPLAKLPDARADLTWGQQVFVFLHRIVLGRKCLHTLTLAVFTDEWSPDPSENGLPVAPKNNLYRK